MTQILNPTRRRPSRKTLAAQETLLRQATAEIEQLKARVAGLEAALDTAQHTYHVPQSLADIKPRRLPPPGKTVMEMIRGQWPGDETDKEIQAALKAMS